MVVEMLQNTFLYSIFFYLKKTNIYIHIQSKNYFSSFVRVLSFKENIFIFSQNGDFFV